MEEERLYLPARDAGWFWGVEMRIYRRALVLAVTCSLAGSLATAQIIMADDSSDAAMSTGGVLPDSGGQSQAVQDAVFVTEKLALRIATTPTGDLTVLSAASTPAGSGSSLLSFSDTQWAVEP